ncbi:Serine/threonine-protein kinase WNK-related isoform 1 [Cucumis melo var. makuwa]|uniref:Serine/threonine-protein kinase WNK-related isoform 1 n=1 Tax=Cucumis melo var. makuwa TaxID=1194695 RepID=A0A5A7VME2_CUCMM|nr:Serine/threonine-protein kinase WNK-related isoform 1 [Cucumis melo var. makuwa]
MVGSGASDRSKEAVGMMALHEALRTVCLNSDWTYSVFWTIRPRPRVRGGNGCKVGDDNGSLMLMWEDGFCRGRVSECLEEIDGDDPVRKAFSKMSIQLYNYGEGLMGKVASDKCHKWVFKEPTECEPNISNYWQSSFDALPPEWTDQFDSGIQTIAVIQAGHGLLQLGSCKIIPEDLHFVLRMRHTFESLGYQSGFYLTQLFSSNRNSSSSPMASKQSAIPIHPPPNLLNWAQRPIPSAPTSLLPSPNFHSSNRLGFPQSKDETHMFLLPHSSEARMEDVMGDHENDIKWPNGLSLFNALTGRADDAKLLFNPESLGTKPDQSHIPLILEPKNANPNSDPATMHNMNGGNSNEFLSLDSQSESARKMENKFKRSFTLPARMASSSSSTSLDHHPHQSVEYRNSEQAGMYSDVMETYLE